MSDKGFLIYCTSAHEHGNEELAEKKHTHIAIAIDSENDVVPNRIIRGDNIYNRYLTHIL